MPWQPKDAKGKTGKADTPGKQRQWSAIANTLLAEGASEGEAIRKANAVIKRRKQKRK